MKRLLFCCALYVVITGVTTAAGIGAETKPATPAVIENKAETASPGTAGTEGPKTKPATPAVIENKAETATDKAETEGPKIDIQIPLFSPLFDKTPIASVNDDPILLEDLKSTIVSVHQQEMEGKEGGKKNYQKILNRLVTTRLILAEADAMGLEELPDIKSKVDAYSLDQLRNMLKMRAAKDLKADDKLVEKFYKDAVLEWKIHSIKFDRKEDADALVKEVASGGDFDTLANKYIDNGKAVGAKEGDYVTPKALQTQYTAIISRMKVGSISPVIPVGPAFTVLKLEAIRYPADNAAAREKARKQAFEIKRNEVLEKYNATVSKKYAVIDTKLLKKLDFEAAKPGFAKMMGDKRVLVRINGEKPITIGDLAVAISSRFFHSIDDAIKKKEVNIQKSPVIANLIYRVAFVKEARRLGIDNSEEYRKAVRDYRDSLVFGQFVANVIAPDVTVPDNEIAAFYQEHIKDFTNPAMVKLLGLVFAKQKQAEGAIDKLRKGTDFDWLKNNAEGQVAKETSDDLLNFSGSLLTIPSLPEGIQHAIEGAKAEDVRLYVSPEGYNYVLLVKNIVPPEQSPLEAVKKNIFNRLYAEKINKRLDDWAGQLKKGYKVKYYMIGRDN